MTDLVIADHQVTFALRPLDGSSRFSLLGLLAGLNGLVGTFAFDPNPLWTTDDQRRLVEELDIVAAGGQEALEALYGLDPLERTSEGTE